MKSTLRNHACTNLGTVAASAIIAAIALTMTGCSGAEGTELDETPQGSRSESVENAPFHVSAPAKSTETAATVEPTARAEQPPTIATPGSDSAAEAIADGTSHESTSDSSTDDGSTDDTSTDDAAGPSTDDASGNTANEPSTDQPSTDEPVASSPAPQSAHSNTMYVSGRQLFDSCGEPFVVRGVEQILGNQLPQGNDWLGLVREIASTGVNAVRILPGVNTLSLDDIDQILTFIGEQNMVAFLAPLGQGNAWYANADVKAMLKKHESFIIIDAYGEPQYDDIERWRSESKAALAEFRALGYEVPLTVTANQFGRGLPSLFDYGQEILAADPQHNTFLGWQAYWGQGGYYQQHYGYTFSEAVQAIVDSGLPIQMGLDHVTDLPSETADYGALMRGAEENGIGWLWWDFYNPYGAENNLSEDGSADNLTATGSIVLESHVASIANTAQRACGH
jgi:hypothetical protein